MPNDMSSVVWALLWVPSVKRERGSLMTSIQSPWKWGDRHRSGAQLRTEPCAHQPCNTQKPPPDPSHSSRHSLLSSRCGTTATVPTHASQQAAWCTSSVRPRIKLCFVLMMSERPWEQPAWRLCRCHHSMSDTHDGHSLLRGTITPIPCTTLTPPSASSRECAAQCLFYLLKLN